MHFTRECSQPMRFQKAKPRSGMRSWGSRPDSLFLAVVLATPAYAQEMQGEGGLASPISQQRLSGDWNGSRSSLEEQGLSIELVYTTDILSNVSGGLKRRTEFIGNIDLQMTADMERLFGWEGGTLFLYGLGNHGGNFSESVGDLQVISNIEGPATVKLFEAWYEQDFLDGRLSVLAGLLDVNTEFDLIPAGTLFVHSAHGMGSDFGNSGKNGPSTFPATSLSTRIRVRPTENTYFQMLVADGVPGDLNDPRRTQIKLDSDDGLLLAGEFGYYKLPQEELSRSTRGQVEELPPSERRYGYFGKYALGVWGYTTDFDDFFRLTPSGDPQQNSGTIGVYALAEQCLYYEDGDPYQGLSVFARLGLADERTNIFDRYIGTGFVYRGLFPGKDEDRLGFAVAATRLGDDFKTAGSSPAGSLDSWEVAAELTYNALIAPGVSVQPGVHYVSNPGRSPGIDNALVIGARIIVSI